MSEKYPVIEGGEAWSKVGNGDRARIGLVVIHGFTGNPSCMRSFGEALSEQGFAVEVPRLPGHGTHWRDMGRTRYDDWKAEVLRVSELLAESCDSIILIGLSMGGTILLDLASEGLEKLSGVVPINATILDRDGLLARLAPLLSKVIPAVPSGAAGLVKNDIAKEGEDERAYPWVPTKAADSFLQQLPRIRQALPQLTVPALVTYSAHDHSVPNENSKAIPPLLGSEEISLLCLERSCHVATLDLDRDLLVESVVDFSDRVSNR